MTQFIDTLVGIFQSSGFARFGEPGGYLYAIMICVGCFLLYLAIVKEICSPSILLPHGIRHDPCQPAPAAASSTCSTLLVMVSSTRCGSRS